MENASISKLNDVTLSLVLALETDVVKDTCYSSERRVGACVKGDYA